MMLRWSKAVALALAFAGAVPLCDASDSKEELVALPAMKVFGSWLAVNYHQGDDGLVTRVVIEEVTPHSPAARLGLRKGDELIAIDDTEVAGMSAEQFVEAYAKDLPLDQYRDYNFRCYRGFFKARERLVRFRITN